MVQISVIIPAYNQATYLRDSIRSVLDQTWRDHEIIVVNDGSTDNTEEIIQEFDDPRLKHL